MASGVSALDTSDPALPGLYDAHYPQRWQPQIPANRTRLSVSVKKVRVGYLDRLDIIVRNDHARAALREMPESNGKVIFQTDAAV